MHQLPSIVGGRNRLDAREIKTAVAHQEAQRAAETPFVNLADPARALGADGKPAVSRRAPIYDDVPDEKWNDWRWQLSNRVNDLEEIERILELTDLADPSQWVIVGRSYSDLADLVAGDRWGTAQADGRRPWTDRYSDLIGAIRD